MPLNLQQAPPRLRKTLYRSDHFWVNTNNSSALPRYSATAYADAEAKLTAANQEATVSFALNGRTPYVDVHVGSGDSHLYVNGVQNTCNAGVEANMVVASGDSSSHTVTDIPVWYSNCIEKATTKYNAYKTRWCQYWRPATGTTQTCEMREPVGLSLAMKYYNKVSVYQKKFRVTYTPRMTPRINCNNSSFPLYGFSRAGADSNDLYDAPLRYTVNSNSLFNWQQPDQTLLVGMYESSKAEKSQMSPFWLRGVPYTIPIKESREGLKIGVMHRQRNHPKPVVIEYTTSPQTVYGKKFDMSEHYYDISTGEWVSHDDLDCFVNFFIYTMQDSSDGAYIPSIEGTFRIESWVDVVFWDRKTVRTSFTLATIDDTVFGTAVDEDNEVENVELEAVD